MNALWHKFKRAPETNKNTVVAVTAHKNEARVFKATQAKRHPHKHTSNTHKNHCLSKTKQSSLKIFGFIHSLGIRANGNSYAFTLKMAYQIHFRHMNTSNKMQLPAKGCILWKRIIVPPPTHPLSPLFMSLIHSVALHLKYGKCKCDYDDDRTVPHANPISTLTLAIIFKSQPVFYGCNFVSTSKFQ